MVTITIDGKKKDNAFQNMPQALAFAYQSGECYGSKKIEIAYASKEKKTDEAKSKNTGGASGNVGATEKVDPVDVTSKNLDEMEKKELNAYAKTLGIDTGFFDNKEKIKAAIKAVLCQNEGAAETAAETSIEGAE